MNPSMSKQIKNQVISAIIFSGLIAAIWLNHSPWLQLKRVNLTVILSLLWLVKIIFLDLSFDTKIEEDNNVSEIEKKLRALRGRFKGAINFLKKTVVAKQGIPINLSTLPWLLMVGPAGSGKTALLAQSDIPFILSKRFANESIEKIKSSETCDWWATKDLVIVDVPGTWFLPEKNPSKLWKQFLSLLKKPSVHEKLGSIVIILNLPELMKTIRSEKKDSYLIPLRKQILELRAALNTKLTFNLVVTKCDLLPGFAEFFKENSREERHQAWGVTLPTPERDENIAEIFCHRFNALIKRVNEQLTWRLHQERNIVARGAIKDFPLQLEKLKELIGHTLKIFTSHNIQAGGVWLTSATQNYAENEINKTIDQQAEQQQSLIIKTSAIAILQQQQPKSFFIRSLILHSLSAPLTKNIPQIIEPSALRIRDAAFAISGGLVIASAIIFGRDFITSEKKVLTIKNSLVHYEQLVEKANENNPRLAPTIPLLDTLESSMPTDQASKKNFIEKVFSFYLDHSQQNINLLYKRASESIFIPSMTQALDKFLQTADRDQPEVLYNVLAARLMLSGLVAYQPSAVANALNRLADTELDQKKLIHHLDIAAKNHWLTAQLNQKLIAFARQQLNQTPTNKLAMIILENQSLENMPENVSGNMHATNFGDILDKAITIAVNAALDGNEVLGKMPPNADQPNAELLIAELHNRYLVNKNLPNSAANNKLLTQNDLSIKNSFNSADFLHQIF